MEEEPPRHLRQRLAPSQGIVSCTTPRGRYLASASRSPARVRGSATSPSVLLPLPEASRCDMGAQTSVSGTCALYSPSATLTVCFRPQHPRPRQGHGLGRKFPQRTDTFNTRNLIYIESVIVSLTVSLFPNLLIRINKQDQQSSAAISSAFRIVSLLHPEYPTLLHWHL